MTIKKPNLVKTIISVSKDIEMQGDFNVNEKDLREIIALCEMYKYHKTNANDNFSGEIDRIIERML